MTLQFSSDTINGILAAAQSANNGTATWGSVYQLVYNALTVTEVVNGSDTGPIDVTTSLPGVDPMVVTWIQGAIGVNTNTGAFATYIRDYTALQYTLRTGQTLSATAMNALIQKASNQIAANFVYQFLTGANPPATINWNNPTLNPSVPTLQAVGGIDAAAAASTIFGGSASSTGLNNYSPWAGTVLFADLGDPDFFENWITQMGAGSFGTAPEQGTKVESGTYDLIAAAEATVQLKTIGSLISLATSLELGGLLSLTSLNAAAINQATTAADQFFASAYGSDVSVGSIGNAIFGNVTGLITAANTYQVGAIAGSTAAKPINLLSDTRVLNAGPGNDTIDAVAFQNQIPAQTTVIDGGAGVNTLSYANDAIPLTVNLQNAGYWNFRFDINPGSAYVTDYAYEIQNLTLSGQGDTVIWTKGFSSQNLNGQSININEQGTSKSPGALNTVDFSQMQGGVTYTDGSISGSLVNFTGFDKIIGSSQGNDTFQINTSDNSSFSRFIGGGASADTFNVTYSKASGPLLLTGGSAGHNTFNFSGAPASNFTVVWGGSGNNTYNFSTSGSSTPNVLLLNMSGVTASNVSDIDLAKLQTYVNQTYNLNSTNPAIIILNPSKTDTIENGGVKLTSPTVTKTSEQINNYYMPEINTSASVLADENAYVTHVYASNPAIPAGAGYYSEIAFAVQAGNSLALDPNPPLHLTLATIDNEWIDSTIDTQNNGFEAGNDLYTFSDRATNTVGYQYNSTNSSIIPVLNIASITKPLSELSDTIIQNSIPGFLNVPGYQEDQSYAVQTIGGFNLLNFQSGEFGITFGSNAPATTVTQSSVANEVTSWSSAFEQAAFPENSKVQFADGTTDITYLNEIKGTQPAQLGPQIAADSSAAVTTNGASLTVATSQPGPTLNIADYLLGPATNPPDPDGGDGNDLDGQGEAVALTNAGDSATASASYDTISLNGDTETATVTSAGTSDTVTATGASDTVTFNGTGGGLPLWSRRHDHHGRRL